MLKFKTIITLLLLILLTGCQSHLLTGEQILVTPATATMKPGQTLELEVIVNGRNGSKVDITPAWSIENASGTLNHTTGQRVVFTAQKVGIARIKVVAHGLTTYAQITIVEPILTELTLTPAEVRIGLGQVRQLTLKAVDQFGDPMVVSPQWTVSPPLATVDANHRLTATALGTGRVIMSVGNHVVSLDLTVEAPVEMPDPSLQGILLHRLRKTDGQLFPYELKQVTELTAAASGITDLTGLNYCTNLTRLDLEGNQITDLKPLSRILTLTDLNVRANQIHDLTPLASLTGLRSLAVGRNPVADLKPLESLIGLERLDLSETAVDEFKDLYGMEMMQELDLSYCWGLDDSDLEVLIYMPELKVLGLKGTPISNLESLRRLRSLTELDIRSALIRDLTPLANCTSLTTLLANDNGIRDITPLKNLTSLKRLNLSMNLIPDITPLQDLLQLEMLYLASNQIEDISPLVQNTGLGQGDQVDITENPLDLTEGSEDLNHLQKLIGRGVIMIGF